MILRIITLVAAYWLVLVACFIKYGPRPAAMCFLISIITAILAALVMTAVPDDDAGDDEVTDDD